MALAVFSEDEQDSIRYHLGYTNVAINPSLSLGIPALGQAIFLIKSAMLRLRESSAGRVRAQVATLESIERKMTEALKRFEAAEVDGIKLRGVNDDRTETDLLEKEYDRWGNRLANLFGVPYYPFAKRYQQGNPLVMSRASC